MQRTTVMLAAFEGWNDAGQSATDVIRHLVATYESTEVRHIRCDGFYDYQVARPITCSIQGRRRILWPQTTFYDIAVSPALHILAQIAPEPNYRWREYCHQSLHIAEEFEVDRIITMGAMFADCPHTRPLPVDVSDNGCQCRMDREYNGPVGIPTILDAMACEEGYDTTTMWVSIPQYLGCDECPQATLRLLDHLSMALGVSLHTGDLGYIDKEGYLHVSGRKKDIIIRHGNNLSAVAIERGILSAPCVKDVCVVGIKDEREGEVPAALVVISPGICADESNFALPRR